KKSLAVAELLARANSAQAKSGSSATAFSKCWRDSCPRSLSERSRPSRNSFLASSDLVVMGIFAPLDAAADTSPFVALLHAVQVAVLSARLRANTKRADFIER